jgi:hypothetical protein
VSVEFQSNNSDGGAGPEPSEMIGQETTISLGFESNYSSYGGGDTEVDG